MKRLWFLVLLLTVCPAGFGCSDDKPEGDKDKTPADYAKDSDAAAADEGAGSGGG